jgi:hypothetical protein
MASDSVPKKIFMGLSGVPWTLKNLAIRGPSFLLGGQAPVTRTLAEIDELIVRRQIK